MPSERTDQLHRLRTLHLFAGAGGGILSDVLLGHQPVCAVEINDYCQQVLSQRQADGMLPWFPIFDDVTTFDGKPWRGHVDVISGGFPCQDISVAGRGDGLDGERSGLWSEMARIIGEVQPRFAFVENSPMLTSRGLDRVLGDLSTLGYDAEWGVVGADDAGAPHKRERIWILAYTQCKGLERSTIGCVGGTSKPSESGETSQHPIGQLADPDLCGRLHGQAEEQPAAGWFHAQREPEPSGEDVADAGRIGVRGEGYPEDAGTSGAHQGDGQERERLRLDHSPGRSHRGGWWSVEPGLGGMVDELADRMDPHGTPEPGSVPRVATGIAKRADRLKAIGNGQVPAAAALAWNTLYSRIQGS